MELVYTNKNFIEKGFLKDFELDVEVGKFGISTNDFELSFSSKNDFTEFTEGSLFFEENTEWGGMVDVINVDTLNERIVLKGKTFRGLLEKEYVQPPKDNAYLILNGEANECLQTLIGNRFGDLYVVDNMGISGINVNYQIRDLNLLEAIEKALGRANARLDIKYCDGKVHLCAEPVRDLSDVLQYDETYNVYMRVETAQKPYNHVLALGSGELTERLRVNLYMQNDGTWAEKETYTGLQRKTFKFEDTNATDVADLTERAIEKVAESNGTEKLDVTIESDDVELFDVVGAKETITGISFKQPITQKILKCTSYGVESKSEFSYKVGE